MEFDIICRTCLKNEKNTKPLFQSNAAEMLLFCNFWEVHEGDGFPNRICDQCDDVLLKSYQFKKLCLASRSALEAFLFKDEQNSTRQDLTLTDTGCIELAREDGTNDQKQHTQSILICTSFQAINEADESEEPHGKDEMPNISLITFEGTEDLQHHTEDYHQNQGNIAPICNEEEELAPIPATLTVPSLLHSCKECTESFTTENDLQLHQSTHTTGELTCISCHKTFAKRQMLKRHIKIHMKVKPHICRKCNKGFAESHALTKHMRSHEGIPREKRHFCSECGQGYSEPFYLEVHMRKHTGERPLVCLTCGKSFADPRSLKVHIMTHTGEKPYKCELCPKAFAQKFNLIKHIRVHTGERPYVCVACGKTFTQLSSLDKHFRIHSGEKPYGCDRCPKRFSDKGALVQHIRTHTGEKPYVCEVCGRAFASWSELKLHDRKHTGVKKHECEYCGKDCATPSSLAIHRRSHTGERPFTCTLCRKCFSEKRSLRRHTQLHCPVADSTKVTKATNLNNAL